MAWVGLLIRVTLGLEKEGKARRKTVRVQPSKTYQSDRECIVHIWTKRGTTPAVERIFYKTFFLLRRTAFGGKPPIRTLKKIRHVSPLSAGVK